MAKFATRGKIPRRWRCRNQREGEEQQDKKHPPAVSDKGGSLPPSGSPSFQYTEPRGRGTQLSWAHRRLPWACVRHSQGPSLTARSRRATGGEGREEPRGVSAAEGRSFLQRKIDP